MKRHMSNAIYGVMDYISYPFGMLIAAPIVLHKLGAAEYGLWMISTAIVSAGGIIASGFSDAGVQRIARFRRLGQIDQMLHTIRAMFAMELALGCSIALIVWIAAPYAAHHIAASHATPLKECLACIRVASIVILVRATEAVSVTTQRAFEEYKGTVQISTAVRLITLTSAAVLASLGMRTESIMVATAIFFAGGTCLQFLHLRRFLDTASIWPIFQPIETRILLATGVFVWVQVVSGVIFRQLDRILLGISLGAIAVAPYSACIQFSEPLFGLTASGLSFFFPYLSAHANTFSSTGLRRSILTAFMCNLFLVVCGTGFLLTFGSHLLSIWAGPEVGRDAAQIFPLIVLGSALSGLSVTGTYAMHALGLFRMVAYISVGSRSAMLLLMLYLLHHHGLHGLAVSRACYGAATLPIYAPLIRQLGVFGDAKMRAPSAHDVELHGGRQP